MASKKWYGFLLYTYKKIEVLDKALTRALTAPGRDRKFKGFIYASPLKRVGAGIIDSFFIVVLFVFFTTIFSRVFWLSTEEKLVLVVVSIYALPVMYFLILRSRAIGKLGLALSIISVKTEKKALWGQVLLRELVKLLTLPVFPIVFLLAVTGKKRRWLHDFVASTAIIIDFKKR